MNRLAWKRTATLQRPPLKRSSLARSIDLILAKFDREITLESSGIAEHDQCWLWNDRQDLRYAQSHPPLETVLHVFHKEWHGIRAAAGSLPGQKLAIPEISLPDVLLSVLGREIENKNPDRIVFHGFSHNMRELVKYLHEADLDDRLFLVFHGSPAQWWNSQERRLVFGMIELAQKGYFQRVHIMKAGMEIPGVPLFEPLLYNISPKHGLRTVETIPPERTVAFAPGWGNWIKNVFGNALGASLSERIDQVWAFAADLQLPSPLDNKLKILKPSDREGTFKCYLAADLSLNVSLIDCHPMVNVECQSVGRACIRSDLKLDRYEDHDYVKLVQVENNNSPLEIKLAVERTLNVPKPELADMTLDYQAKIDALALSRYVEFLGL